MVLAPAAINLGMGHRIVIKILSLCLLLAALFAAAARGATDPGDYAILDKFRKGLSNAELLEWPDDNQDPCGEPRWRYVFCSGNRVTQIQSKGLGLIGSLPEDFNKLTMLENIGLQSNQLKGPLPSFKGLSKLKFAYLDFNQFDSIPADFFDGLDNLQVINLDKNPLNANTGWMLPPALANSALLTNLSASTCNLVGPLPDFLGNLHSLRLLELSSNSLTGKIPASFSDLPLNTLWLDNNKLVGQVPAGLASSPQLQSLHLDNNAFMGPIPKVTFDDFTFSDNSFCQSVPGIPCPPEVSALLDFLDGVGYPQKLMVSWSGNNSCTALGITCAGGKATVINLPNYHLNGTISPSLGNLDALTEIFLQGNNLTGTIPSSLTKLKSLKLLNLSSNSISPPFPKFSNAVTVILDGNTPPANSSSDSSDTSGSSGGSSSSKSKTLVIVIPIVIVVIVIVLATLFLFYCKRWKKKSSRPVSIVVHPRDSSDPHGQVKITVANSRDNRRAAGSGHLSLNNSEGSDAQVIEAGNLVISIQVLRDATRNFAPENELGRGGFGVVYKGELSDGTNIAVKRTESLALSNKAWDEFKAEIAVLSRVRHRHLVSILGYSMEENEKLLVYEYMPQGALSKHLFYWKEERLQPLSWKHRLHIALDVARGLEYLHRFANECFIHRDFKSSNILLGDDYRAKISDFGLAKLAPDGKHSLATKLAGTFGYLAPEYAATGKVSVKVDVFSFGVVLMELVTGLKALDGSRPEERHYLLTWFCQMEKEDLKAIIDSTLTVADDTFDSICTVAGLAVQCAARDPGQRPDMCYAVGVLAPLVEKWKLAYRNEEDCLGVDMSKPLLQMVMGWEASDGNSDSSLTINDNSKESIPTGVATSFALSGRALAGALFQDQQAGYTLLSVRVDGHLRWKVGTWVSGRYLHVNCPTLLVLDAGAYEYEFQQNTRCSVDI
ncbi:hypothetical protein ZIOFF_049785 [Zingiber officinale]|uniref:Protein kinase domain-containing protein n=2 Tax=Zingiber officinale TaxID=94328 RepID=A0A8J5FHU4_ZINOF|nr:hypothetical protein ZIOFF_049785 [Zingiber officinale]